MNGGNERGRPGRPKAGSLLAHPPSAIIPLRLLGGGASFTSATTGLSQNAHPSRRDGRAPDAAPARVPAGTHARLWWGSGGCARYTRSTTEEAEGASGGLRVGEAATHFCALGTPRLLRCRPPPVR